MESFHLTPSMASWMECNLFAWPSKPWASAHIHLLPPPGTGLCLVFRCTCSVSPLILQARGVPSPESSLLNAATLLCFIFSFQSLLKPDPESAPGVHTPFTFPLGSPSIPFHHTHPSCVCVCVCSLFLVCILPSSAHSCTARAHGREPRQKLRVWRKNPVSSRCGTLSRSLNLL